MWLSSALPGPIHQRTDVETDRIGAREASMAQSGRTLTAASRCYGPWVQTPENLKERRGEETTGLETPYPRGSRPRETPNAMERQRKGASRVIGGVGWRVSEIRPGSRRIW